MGLSEIFILDQGPLLWELQTMPVRLKMTAQVYFSKGLGSRTSDLEFKKLLVDN